MVNYGLFMFRPRTGSPHCANSCPHGRRYRTHPCLGLTNHELCRAIALKANF
jgi:hypothetical protein